MTGSGTSFVRAAQLDGAHFSTVIVGAGINGVGVFRDLSLQGVDCLIFDKGDFAAGASSAPSRMIHGGLRYLENGDFSLVAESTRERNLLLRNAPHLVRPLKTVVPLSSRFGGLLDSVLRFLGFAPTAGATRGLFVVALGLRLYDMLGRRQRMMPGHSISRVKPADGALFRDSVRWTATYFDAWISHPEWLIMELLEDAQRDQPDSKAANYCRVIRCEGNALILRDEITGEDVRVTADVVVNATGAWLDQSAATLAGQGSRVMGTKGSHLVLDHPALKDALDGRMAYFEASDGRVCIVYPFLDRVLVGSTDIPVEDPDAVRTEPQEIDYLLAVLRELFPQMSFEGDAVVYTFVGVRPLARSDANRPGQISRDHAVAVEPANARRAVPLVCLVGGKWTTFRSLAAEACDAVLELLARTRRKSTENLPIGGGTDWPADALAMRELLGRIQAQTGLGARRAADLVSRYGSCALPLAQRFGATGDVALRHAPDYSVGEICHLCLHTGVARLSDLVMRRTLLAIRGHVTDALLAELAGIAGEALHWNEARRREELAACTSLLRDRHHVPLATVAVPGPLAAPFEASLPPETISSPVPL